LISKGLIVPRPNVAARKIEAIGCESLSATRVLDGKGYRERGVTPAGGDEECVTQCLNWTTEWSILNFV